MAHSKKSIYSLVDHAKVVLGAFEAGQAFSGLYEKDDFVPINAYLADKASQENKNIYISTSNKESARLLTLPILYPAACRLLLENSEIYGPSLEDVKVGHIFISGGVCMSYVFFEGKHSLVTKVKAGYKYRHFTDAEKIFRSFFLADAKFYSDRKCHKALSDYRAFYAKLSGTATIPPSLFAKKMVVVCQKADLYKQFRDLSLFHSLPMAGITKNHSEVTDETLPLDPMVLIASDYELARDYMLAHCGDTIFDYLLLTGDNKIGRLKALVKNDCANGLFARFCLVGNHAIPKDNSMLLWHWTNREEKNLSGKHSLDFIPDPVDGCESLVEASRDFYSCLKGMYEDLGAQEHFSEIRHCFHRILYDKLDSVVDFDSELGEPLKNQVEKAMLADNYDREDFSDDLDALISLLGKVHSVKRESPTIWDKLVGFGALKLTLITHNSQGQRWEDQLVSMGLDNIRVIPYKYFKRELLCRDVSDNYYLGFLPNHSQTEWLYAQVLNRKVTIHLALYPPEISIFQTQLRKIRKWEYRSNGPKDLSIFPDLDLETPEREAAEDIIGRFEDNYAEATTEEGRSLSDGRGYTIYSLEVQDSNGAKRTEYSPMKVLRIDDGALELVPVSDLEQGDVIMLYRNRSRDSLYDILSQESDQFARVNAFSKLWKRRLKEYLDFTVKKAGDDDDVMIDSEKLQKISASIGINPESIYKRWILRPDAIRFPLKNKLDRVLAFLRNEGLLEPDDVNDIQSARSFFMGVMISLGQNLSSEVQSVMLGQEGSLGDFIARFVVDNEREYPLLSRFDEEAVTSIVRHNYEEFTFVQLVEPEEEDGE